jgi:hypothetical protein
MAEGGGDEPMSDERSPPCGDARMLLVVGIAGEFGTARLDGRSDWPMEETPERTDPGASKELLDIMEGREGPLAEEKLEMELARSSFRPRRLPARGVLAPPDMSMGDELVGEEGRWRLGGEDMVVLAIESARSDVDSSFDRVRIIFFEGDWPMLRYDYGTNVDGPRNGCNRNRVIPSIVALSLSMRTRDVMCGG